jgi:mono/diheme cytochrome c family protein
MKYVLILIFVSLVSSACNKKPGATSSSTSSSQSALIDRGRVVYQTNCISCHNSDPKKAGSIGPDVFGSSKALLEARILRADYPPDYHAKRMTHVMNALPHLKDEIDAIHAYLNAQ